MAHIRRRNGKFFVEIRKRYGQKLYATFDKLSDARSFAKETELKIQQNRFRDISEASKTSLKIVLHRYLREIIKDKSDKRRERSKYNVILRNDICNKTLTDLRTSDFAKYRDERLAEGISNSTINRELSAIRVAIQTSIDEWDCWLPENPVKTSIKVTETEKKSISKEIKELEVQISTIKKQVGLGEKHDYKYKTTGEKIKNRDEDGLKSE